MGEKIERKKRKRIGKIRSIGVYRIGGKGKAKGERGDFGTLPT